jgi:hypothetical protein
MSRIGSVTVAMMVLIAGMSGCSSAFIAKRPMAWEVLVMKPEQVASCQPKGGVLVTAAAYLWFYQRSDEAVEENLVQLARNAAIDAGGDALVPGESPKPGTRNFAIYRCRP